MLCRSEGDLGNLLSENFRVNFIPLKFKATLVRRIPTQKVWIPVKGSEVS